MDVEARRALARQMFEVILDEMLPRTDAPGGKAKAPSLPPPVQPSDEFIGKLGERSVEGRVLDVKIGVSQSTGKAWALVKMSSPSAYWCFDQKVIDALRDVEQGDWVELHCVAHRGKDGNPADKIIGFKRLPRPGDQAAGDDIPF